MADIDRIELLMRLSQNMRADNDVWRKEVFSEGFERYKRAAQLMQMFEQEYRVLDMEIQRLEAYAPQQPNRQVEPPMPKAVTQGPKP
jgi:hypothetical protein